MYTVASQQYISSAVSCLREMEWKTFCVLECSKSWNGFKSGPQAIREVFLKQSRPSLLSVPITDGICWVCLEICQVLYLGSRHTHTHTHTKQNQKKKHWVHLFDGTDLTEAPLMQRRTEMQRRFDCSHQQLALHSDKETENVWVADNNYLIKCNKVMVTWYFKMPSGL